MNAGAAAHTASQVRKLTHSVCHRLKARVESSAHAAAKHLAPPKLIRIPYQPRRQRQTILNGGQQDFPEICSGKSGQRVNGNSSGRQEQVQGVYPTLVLVSVPQLITAAACTYQNTFSPTCSNHVVPANNRHTLHVWGAKAEAQAGTRIMLS